jgi:uncharacterized protein
MNQILARYNPWWESGYIFQQYHERPSISAQIDRNLANKQVIFITGLRRIGKTCMLKLYINKLIHEHHIDTKDILYVSLDNYMLSRYSIPDIIDEFRKIHRHLFEKKLYLFFDEITWKSDYEIQLKNIVDQQTVKIFASSSSASVLKNRKPALTGRHTTIEMLPLDFEEYLSFKNIKIKIADEHLLETHFIDYLQTGGIPEYVLGNEISYLHSLVDDIIFKDIVAMHQLKNPQLVKDFFLLLMERSGKVISINKIASILQISPDSARRILGLFAEVYLIFKVQRSGKTNEQILSPQKIYAPDLGIRNLFTGFRDMGSLFENYVFLKIKHLEPKYIYTDKTEIDFITRNKTLIEVKYHDEPLSDKQQNVFSELKAQKKYIIRNHRMLKDLLSENS